MENELVTVKNNELIESKIIMCRNQQVMLDSDVAELFGVGVKRLNQQMKRNKKRFPEDFCFQISKTEEMGVLRSHFATANTVSSKRRYNPYVYTEKDTLDNAGHFDGNIYLHAIVSVLAVYAICTLIDFLRIQLLEKPFFKWFDSGNNKNQSSAE